MPIPNNITVESFEAKVNIENSTDCQEQYQSDDSDSENETHDSEQNDQTSSEHITTAQFVKNLQSVRSYLQSRGANEQIYNLLHELDIIALQDKLNPATSNQSRITSFFENR